MVRISSVTFEYFDGTNWTQAIDYAGNNAVIRFELNKALNNPATLSIALTNPSKNFSSTTVTKSDANSSQGNLMSVLTDFMQCRIKDISTNSYLFRGRIYHIAHEYDLSLGAIIRVTAKDALAELGEFPCEAAPLSLRKINLTNTATNTVGEIIAYIINGISDNIDTTNTDKFELSAATVSAREALINKVDADGDGLLDIGKSSKSALRMIYELAQADDRKTDTRDTTGGSSTGHIGYDYYIDPSYTRLDVTTDAAKPQMNYFLRGTRPGLIGTTLSDPTKHGLTLEFPSSGFTGETNFKHAIKPTSTFDTDTNKLYTSAVVTTNIIEKSASGTLSTAQQGGAGIHMQLSLELIEGTITNVAGWEGRALLYVANESTTSTQHQTGTATGTVSPLFLYEHGQTSPCATLHYQSGTGANQYCIIGDIHTAEEVTRGENVVGKYVTDNDRGYTGVTFRAFPISGTVRLFTTKANGLGTSSSAITTITEDLTASETDVTVSSASNLQKYDVITIGAEDMYITAISSNTLTVVRKYNGTVPSGVTHDSGDNVVCMFIDINAATCRQSVITNMARPKRVIFDDFDSSDKVKREVAGALDRFTRKSITSANVHLAQYPFVKLDAVAAKVTRSGNTINFASASFALADGSGTINNPEQFGVRKGHVIAELTAGGEINRYALIASTTASAIVYGNSSTDNSDGTALDASKDMQIFIPVEVGHSVRVKNKLWNKDFNILVQDIVYGISNTGQMTCELNGAGLDNNSIGVLDYNLPAQSDIQKPYITTPDGYFSGQWKIVGGSIEAGHSSTASDNHDHVKVVAADGTSSLIKVVLPNGASYPLAVGNYTIPAAEVDTSDANLNKKYTLFLRAAGRLTTPLSSNVTHLQVVVNEGAAPTYADVAQPLNDIIFGTAQADDDVNGMVNLELYQSAGNTNKPSLDVETIPNNRLTSILLKKGNQGWSTDLVIQGTAWNVVKWHEDGEADDQAGTISFSDNSTESITADTSGALGNAGTWYLYKRIGDSANAALVLTQTYSVVYQDDRVLLAIIVRASSSDGSGSPTILPFNSSVPTMSVGALSAGAITADAIQTNAITAAKLEANLALVTNLMIPNANVSSSQAGIIISSSGIKGYNDASTGVVQFEIDPGTGTGTFGGGKAQLSTLGVSFAADSGTAASILWRNNNNQADGSPSYSWFYKTASGDNIGFLQDTGSDKDFSITNYDVNIISGSLSLTSSLSSGTGTALAVDGNEKVITVSSSRRYKENIVDLTTDSTKVLELRTRNFKYKDYTDRVKKKDAKEGDERDEVIVTGKSTFGLIAEEVYEILPEVVSLNKDSAPESIDYGLLSVLLIEEVKKLRTEVNTLKNG